MAQVNGCLSCIFTIFNILFAIIGGLIIVVALIFQILTNDHVEQQLESWTPGFIGLYVVGAITMMIAILGACGAHRESKVSLIVFLVCTVIGTLLMLRVGIRTAAIRPELVRIMETDAHNRLPLDQASEEVKALVEHQQKELHCCGLFSYKDWEDNIPDSCLCNQEEQMEGKCEAVRYRVTLQRDYVYSQSCFPIIRGLVLRAIDITIGVNLTLAILGLLGMILSSIIIHQMRRPNRPTVLLSVPGIFTPPPKYQELHNPLAY
ncbi:tetraspanin-8-like [Epinephelus fuscoguttatus]|uniref:tetraspanin-8-like n=1 Tax=Epinephelus fuscoguttatus TaxID=293821 RepID=UPI0020D1289B|nr:tetraspanin-8-like [Epinephelus fuscoguttatus]